MKHQTRQAAEWIYRGLWGVLVRWFRVPQEPPTLPVRPGETVHSFQPADGYLRYLKFWFWLVLLIVDLALTAAWIAIIVANPVIGAAISPIALFIIIVPDILAYIAIHLRYDTTWYVMTDRSLRIRRGVMAIHEVTITFENVQNVSLQRGPLQKYFGIADLIVQTAGGGAAGPHGQGAGTGHLGIIEGISNAEELRDRIMSKLRDSKSAGLGDDAHEHAPAAPQVATSMWTAEHLAVLAEIREGLKSARVS
jgi:membrane protein YdbS with pleckstrin-like domain